MNTNTFPLDALPDALRPVVETALDRCEGIHAGDLGDATREALPAVWAMSEFVARACIGNPAMLRDLDASGDLERTYEEGTYHARLVEALSEVTSEADLHRAVRRFREREMVRIAWRDLTGRAELEEVLTDLSSLAEHCIDLALDWLYRALCERWGTPLDRADNPQQLIVLGMGKLGGRELNFSSDIDLIFAFPEAGETDGARPRSNEEFFTRLGRQLIAALDQQTADGRAFRVDMRLRPYGSAGALAMSFSAMELYYQDQGREWERYALIKARVVGGDRESGAELTASLRPFVFRRFLDYGVLESLREMKALVSREVRRKGLAENIKLGRGGIREIEFIAQVFQLIRGGQERPLRRRRLLPVLQYLGEHGQIPEHACRQLVDGYRFLRRAENRLQAMHDQQTHDLPKDETDQARLAFAMGYDNYSGFLADLERWRRVIQGHFDQVFMAPQSDEQEEEHGEDEITLGDIWHGGVDEEQGVAVFRAEGFEQPEESRRRLVAMRESRRTRALSASGRTRLDRLMPLLLHAVAEQDNPDATLERLMGMLEGIVRRTAYLSLLVEHPMALSQLVQLASGSPWVCRLLGLHPILLDELLDPRTLYAPLRREGLAEELDARLSDVADDDLESQMEVLRRFKQTNVLRVAAADIGGALPIMVVSDYLTDIAEVTLAAVLEIARNHMRARYGRPMGTVEGSPREQGFVVLAYGKLGSIELGYGSDLDLVFVHEQQGESLVTDGDRPVDNAVFFARLAQRIIHILGTTTPGGTLYEVDTRLRPSGKAGLLATSLDAYAEYQREKAWTWEHQALVRARVVAGDASLAERVEAVRRETLGQRRDTAKLREEVVTMRERMLREKASRDPGAFDVKQDEGGIADIEFMVQYGVLAGACENPGLLRYTDNIRLLDELARSGFLTADRARRLADAYRAFRARIHRLTLQEKTAVVANGDFEAEREDVREAWREIMAPAPGT